MIQYFKMFRAVEKPISLNMKFNDYKEISKTKEMYISKSKTKISQGWGKPIPLNAKFNDYKEISTTKEMYISLKWYECH